MTDRHRAQLVFASVAGNRALAPGRLLHISAGGCEVAAIATVVRKSLTIEVVSIRVNIIALPIADPLSWLTVRIAAADFIFMAVQRAPVRMVGDRPALSGLVAVAVVPRTHLRGEFVAVQIVPAVFFAVVANMIP